VTNASILFTQALSDQVNFLFVTMNYPVYLLLLEFVAFLYILAALRFYTFLP
jgi:hypothetical protein